jgi:hypothetical protein
MILHLKLSNVIVSKHCTAENIVPATQGNKLSRKYALKRNMQTKGNKLSY